MGPYNGEGSHVRETIRYNMWVEGVSPEPGQARPTGNNEAGSGHIVDRRAPDPSGMHCSVCESAMTWWESQAVRDTSGGYRARVCESCRVLMGWRSLDAEVVEDESSDVARRLGDAFRAMGVSSRDAAEALSDLIDGLFTPIYGNGTAEASERLAMGADTERCGSDEGWLAEEPASAGDIAGLIGGSHSV